MFCQYFVTVSKSSFQVLWSATSDASSDNIVSAGLGWTSADMFSAEKQNHWSSISVCVLLCTIVFFLYTGADL